jgi:hypothetical protein
MPLSYTFATAARSCVLSEVNGVRIRRGFPTRLIAFTGMPLVADKLLQLLLGKRT